MSVTLQETAERRQITIVHCDIVNSTAIIDGLDPEDVLSIMLLNLNSWTKIVEKFQGIFAGYTGDGFHAYFGYPYAREDAAADALNAALEVSRMFAKQEHKVQRKLKCRVGVATGQVVIAGMATEQIGQRFVAFGSVPSLAARLEQASTPGGILVDSTTMKLTEDQFVFRDIGVVPAKGFKRKVEAWEVLRKRRPLRRFHAGNLSPYVGRAYELGVLFEKWQSAVQGKGQAVLVKGEAGIGKSRLVFEFEQSLGCELTAAFRFQCSSQNTSTALHPWFHWLKRYADIRHHDNAKTTYAKLHHHLHAMLGFSHDVVTSSETIMGVRPLEVDKQDGPSPRKVLMRLQRTLIKNIVNAAKHAPLYVLVEDIHWMDASTESLIRILIKRARRKKIFLVLTSRPDYERSFDCDHVTTLQLARLDDEAVSKLVSTIISDSDEFVAKSALMSTIGKCEGNPFFVEELSKHYLEQESPDSLSVDRRSRGNELPALLQGSLLQRIDMAGEGKEMAQLASVIGREFDRDILMRLSDQPAKRVQKNLDQLCELDILSHSAVNDRAFYSFRHALLREAVYSSLLRNARKAIHLKVAPLLASERQTYSAEIIARHFEHGGERDSAFGYWLEAGQHALQSGATKDAVSLLERALSLVQYVPRTKARREDLASMYLTYGRALNALLGVAADPIKYFEKAEELAAQANQTEMLLESLDWQFGMHFNAGKLSAAREPALKMKRLGLTSGDRRALASGYQGLGMVYFMRGDLVDACDEFEEGLKTAGKYISGVHCFPSMLLSYLAWTYFILGRSRKAAASAKRAIASARRESSHALAAALSNCSYVYQGLGDVEKVYACAGELIAHAEKHGEHMYLKRGIKTRKWADFVSGSEDNAIEAIKEHIDHLLRSKEEIEVTYHLGVLADLQVQKERYQEAAASLNQAFKIARKNNEYFYVAELYRLKAVLREQAPDALPPGDNTDYLVMAKNSAKSQQAEAWLNKLADHLVRAEKRLSP